MTTRTLNNDVLSYLTEIQELADAEFGIKEMPDQLHEYNFKESDILVLYFAIKSYMRSAIEQGTGGQVIVHCGKLLEILLPDAREFTKNKIDHINKIRPEQFTSKETDYLTDAVIS